MVFLCMEKQLQSISPYIQCVFCRFSFFVFIFRVCRLFLSSKFADKCKLYWLWTLEVSTSHKMVLISRHSWIKRFVFVFVRFFCFFVFVFFAFLHMRRLDKITLHAIDIWIFSYLCTIFSFVYCLRLYSVLHFIFLYVGYFSISKTRVEQIVCMLVVDECKVDDWDRMHANTSESERTKGSMKEVFFWEIMISYLKNWFSESKQQTKHTQIIDEKNQVCRKRLK